MKKAFFVSVALIAALLILYCAVTGGIQTKKMNEYNAQKAAIINAPPKTVDGLVYFNRLTSAEQYIYEKISSAVVELDKYTPKMAFVPTEDELRHAVDALLHDDPSIFYIDPDGFNMNDLEIWYTKAEAEITLPPETEPETESPATEYTEETENDGPPDIPVITDPPATETEATETDGETEEETAEIVQQVIDDMYAKLKIPYIYSKEDIQIMSKRLSASLIKSDLAVAECENDFEKALALHDYLTDVTKNSIDAELYNTAYGALVSGGADGRGYALAYKLLLSRNGMISHVTYGKYKNIDSAWNVALLSGKYYNIDVYASDPEMTVNGESVEGIFTHAYFCVNDEFLSSTHTISEGIDVPKCTEPDNYYDIFSLNARNVTMLENISKRLIDECLENGEDFFELYVSYTYDTGAILDTVEEQADKIMTENLQITMYIPINGVPSYVFKVEKLTPPLTIEPPATAPNDTTDTNE